MLYASVRPKEHSNPGHGYTLSFTINFEHAKDTVFIGFAVPYTYTQLQNMVHSLLKDANARRHLRVNTICRSLGGNRCDLLTITEMGDDDHVTHIIGRPQEPKTQAESDPKQEAERKAKAAVSGAMSQIYH